MPICGRRRLRASSSTSRTSIRARASVRRSASRRSGSRSATRSRPATSRSGCASSNRRSSSISSPTTATTSMCYESGSRRARSGTATTASAPRQLALLRTHAGRAAALREGRHRRRVSLPVGLGRTRVDRASRHLRPRRAHEPLGQGPAPTSTRRRKRSTRRSSSKARPGMDRTTLMMLVDAYENERPSIRRAARRRNASCCVSIRRSRRFRSACFRSRATSPSWSSAHERSNAPCGRCFRTQYDEGNVGQLYRRQDEIGTPSCIMVDYETLADGYGDRARPRQHAPGPGRRRPAGDLFGRAARTTLKTKIRRHLRGRESTFRL